jgi:hypothetical protein
MCLTVRPHNLSGHPTRVPKLLFSAGKPVLFDFRSFRVQQVGLGVAIHEESDCKHITIGGLVANALAGIALHSRQIGATTSVRAGKSTLRRARGVAASTIVAAVIPPAVVSAIIGVAITSISGAAPTCIAVYPIVVPSSVRVLLLYPESP